MQNLSDNGLKVELSYKNLNLLSNPFFGKSAISGTTIPSWDLGNCLILSGDTYGCEISLLAGLSISQIGTPQRLVYPGNINTNRTYCLSLLYQNVDAGSTDSVTVLLKNSLGTTIDSKSFLLGSAGASYKIDSQVFTFNSQESFQVVIQAPTTGNATIKGIALTFGEIPPSTIFPRFADDRDLDAFEAALTLRDGEIQDLQDNKEPTILSAPGDTETQKRYVWRGNKTWQLLDLDSEITSRADADLSEITSRRDADLTEITSRTEADITLQNNINVEVTARRAADTTLTLNLLAEITARMDATNFAEKTLRQDADTTLTLNLLAEKTLRQDADTTLTLNLLAETTARLNAFIGANQSLATSGYQKLPGGLILQWGMHLEGVVTFPIAFPTKCCGVFGTCLGSNVAAWLFSSPSLTGFTWFLGPQDSISTGPWYALGY